MALGDDFMNTISIRVSVTMAPYLKEKLELMSDFLGCSQAEVIRISLLKFWETER